MKNVFAGLIALLLVLSLSACSNPGPRNKGVVLLLDTSGTYTKELGRAQALINALLVEMEPGDSFAVDRINTASFTEKDIIAKVTFSDRPSEANQQKRQFRDIVDKFVKTVKPSRYTDITGGILQAIEYLNEKNTGKKTILVYSDLKQDLPKVGTLVETPEYLQFVADSGNIVQGEYSLKDILSFTKCNGVSGGGIMKIYMHNDLPLVIEYNVGGLGYMKLVIDPLSS